MACILGGRSTRWSLLLQAEVSSVIVVHVLSHEMLEMPLVKCDDVIEQLPAATGDEALSDSILPRAAEVSPLRLNAEALDGIYDLIAEVGGPIKDQIPRRFVVGDQAAHDPRHSIRGMLAYRVRINLQHAPVVRFRYVGIDPVNGDIDATRAIDQAQIWGMCLPDHCAGGLGRGRAYVHLTEEQYGKLARPVGIYAHPNPA
jgi:hypothetical protein